MERSGLGTAISGGRPLPRSFSADAQAQRPSREAEYAAAESAFYEQQLPAARDAMREPALTPDSSGSMATLRARRSASGQVPHANILSGLNALNV